MAQQIWIRPRLCGKKCLDPAGSGSKFRIPLKATYTFSSEEENLTLHTVGEVIIRYTLSEKKSTFLRYNMKCT